MIDDHRGGEAGVTLLEAMVLAAILGLVVYLASGLLSDSERFAKNEYEKLKARHVLDRSIADIIASGGFYPPMRDGAKAVSYVACYNMQGMMMNNRRKKTGVISVVLPDTAAPSPYCPDAKFEVHVTPATDASNTAEVIVLVVSRQGEKKVEYRSRVALESAL